MKLDPETLDRLRGLPAQLAYEEVKAAVYRAPGGTGSWEIKEAVDLLVEEGILTWEEVEAFEGGPLE
jgi:hypothetical protein